MKKIFSIFLISIVITMFFSSCSSNKIKVDSTNFPTGEIQQGQTLVFTFNKDLAPDSLLNMSDTTTYIKFEPKIHGTFEWIATNQLSFSPVEQFRPFTKYKAFLTKNLLAHSKEKYKIDEQAVLFHTPNLKITNTETYWTTKGIVNKNNIFIGVNLYFNYEVNPAKIFEKLKVLQDSKVLTVQLNGNEPSNEIKLLITPPPGVNFPNQLKFLISKGVSCLGSKQKTTEALTYLSQVPDKNKFEIVNSLPDFVNGKSIIKVTTTQPVINKDIDQYISINPSVSFQISPLSNGFIIKGNFSKDKEYKLSISGNLTSIFDVKLRKDYAADIHFGNPPPYLAFTDKKSIYISSKGNKNIGISVINIPKVKLTVFKIYKNNIEDYLRNGQQYEYEDGGGDGDNYYSSYDYTGNTHYGDTIATRIYNTVALQKNGNTSLLNIKLSDFQYTNANKGIYLIKIQDPKKPWLQDRKLIAISDLGLIVKKGTHHIYTLCHSLLNADALSDVKISYITNNNQDIYSSVTNKDGVSNFDYNPKEYPGSDVTLVMAQKGNDFTFMNLNDNSAKNSAFDVGGKTTTGVPYDVFMYSNRDLYRPGDTIHINSIVRNFKWETLKNAPVKFKVEMPNGKQLTSFKEKLNSEGAAEIAFSVPAAAMTGSYNVEMYSGNDVFLKSYSFLVEDFMPITLKVKLKTDKPDYKSSETVNLGIKVNHLYGPPATNKTYDVALNLDFAPFNPKGYDDYTFNVIRPDNTYFDEQDANGKTNSEGEAVSTFKLPDNKDVGILKGKALVSVFDATGRPVNVEKDFNVYTQNTFYGIRNFSYWLSSTHPLNFYFAALNKNAKPVNASAYVEVVKHTWETVLVYSGSSSRYRSQEKTQTVYSKNIQMTGGKGQITFLPQVSGDYEIRIYNRAGSNAYVSQSFYAYKSGTTAYNSFKVQKEGQIQIKADKATYRPGDDAKLLFTCPFDGNLIVTVEQNEVLKKYYLKTAHKAASLTIPITGDYLPNVYISATVLRPLSDNSIPLTIARGVIPLMVAKPENKLKVKILAVDKSRSKTTQIIRVKTKPHAQVTIGVTDEGTLMLTNFQTPDPYGYFYGKRALEVHSYNLYPSVLPELYASSVGGDMKMKTRVNPVSAKRYHPVAFWSGILTADADGNCSYTIHIPEYNGALRVMATAYKGKSFGSSDHTIKVADPIVIETSLPRFLSPGDECVLNVSLTNTTKKTINATANLNTTNPLAVDGAHSQEIKLPPGAEQSVIFKVQAQQAIGAANVNVIINGMGEKFTKHTQISVRPAAPLQKITGSGVLSGNESKNISILDDFIGSTTNGYFVLSKSPMAQFTKNLNQLLQYPYGCMEQTISTAFPILHYGALVKSLGQKSDNLKYNPSYIINQAIQKIYSQQQYNGGITYWPGQGRTDWWVSAYAMHFLIEAKKAGYNVAPSVMNNLAQYLKSMIDTKKTESYWYWDDNNQLKNKLIVPKATIYSLYVLALDNKPDISTMNYFKSSQQLLTLSSKYVLAATYALTGDMKSYGALLPEKFDGERAKRTLDEGYYSYVKDQSIALMALLQVDPKNSQIPVLANHISMQLKNDKWLSTQDNAFALLALGKLAENAVKSNISANLIVNGSTVTSLSQNKITTKFKGNFANKNIKISTSGTGHLYYFYEQSGISKSGKVKETDSYLRVRKTFYDQAGNKVYPSSFNQGQLIVVKIALTSLDNRCVPNVAVTDILPACFEIQNPRINPDRELKWIKDKSDADYMDIRDDRITFFTTACPKTKYFYYLVRVTTQGTYTMGPVAADAMYDGSYHSYSGSGKITVHDSSYKVASH